MSTRVPRLLLLAHTPHPAPTGASVRLAQRVEAFGSAGYHVDVLVPRRPGMSHLSRLPSGNVLRVPVPSEGGPEGWKDNPGADYAALERAALRQVATGDYDGIHAMEPFTGWSVLDSIRGSGTKVVYESPGALPGAGDDPLLAGELRRRERALLREADRVIITDHEQARRITDAGTAPSRQLLLPPSTNVRRFSPSAGARVPASPLQIVLPAARFDARDADALARILAALPAVFDVRVVVLGEVERRARRILSDDEDLGGRVTLAGAVPHEELPPRLASAHVGLVLATRPVRAQALVEMMAVGLAVVAPDSPGTRALAAPHEVVLVPPGEPEVLAGALQTLIAQPHRRSLLSEAARRRAVEAFDERAARVRLLGAWGNLLNPSVEIAASAWDERSAEHPAHPELLAGHDSDLTPLAFDHARAHGTVTPERDEEPVTAPLRNTAS